MMKGSMSTELGIITISPEVIAKYAGSVAVECFGIVGMAAVNMKDGLVRLLKRESLTHGIHVDISDDNILVLDFHVIVAYGVNILSVSEKLHKRLHNPLFQFLLPEDICQSLLPHLLPVRHGLSINKWHSRFPVHSLTESVLSFQAALSGR